jgi:hypothetical protein
MIIESHREGFFAQMFSTRRLKMSHRFLASICALVPLLWAPSQAAGQTPSSAAKASAAAKWTPPRTPDGRPDLQGIWSSSTLTPLERPVELAGKPVLTPAEAAAYEKQLIERGNRDIRGESADVDVAGAYNELWFDRGKKVVGSRRTSLIVDPPDGRVPSLTPEAQKKVDAARAYARLHPADGPEDRPLAERCMLWPTAGPPMLPGPYNNNYQIVQAPGYVVILVEMIHDARIIPIDGRPHLPQSIRQWLGDPRGHWEGNTLVVETANFTDKTSDVGAGLRGTTFRGSDDRLRLIERFTRVDPDTILYQFTVDDPTAFTKQWTAQIPMTKIPGPFLEYACHEGNYAMRGVLAGARAEEKKAGSK